MRADGLTDECKKFLGVKPFDTITNICLEDGYYLQSLYTKYGQQDVDAEIKKIRKELQRP